MTADHNWMPMGFDQTDEAQLHKASILIPPEDGHRLRDWWLEVTTGSPKTPNWDIASQCTVHGERGLLLVEAKAHSKELIQEEAGKSLRPPVRTNSRRNHVRIASSIQNANLVLSEATGTPWTLSHEWNYQMSNRFTWACKLTELGYHVVVVYLGFLNAIEMDPKNERTHFGDHDEWEALVKGHSKPLFPDHIWNKELRVNDRSLIPLIRSTQIAYDRPVDKMEEYND